MCSSSRRAIEPPPLSSGVAGPDSPKNLRISGLAMLVVAAVCVALLWWLVPGTFFYAQSALETQTRRRNDPTWRFLWGWAALDVSLAVCAARFAWMGIKSLYWSFRGEPDEYL